jgi:O-methyltransferase
MKHLIRSGIAKCLAVLGYRLQRISLTPPSPFTPDLSGDIADTIRSVQPFTMTTPERIYSIIQAVEHILKHNIPGDIVECGVWRGGSMMAAAKTLIKLGAPHRKLWLYDTFEGMTQPTNKDFDFRSIKAADYMKQTAANKDTSNHWAISRIEEVKQHIQNTGYPDRLVKYVEGKVEATIPKHIPDSIAILRLDTCWYESTRHELEHLFPILSQGGILILNDYGHWAGAREAVNEYIAKHNLKLLLCRVDYTGRIAVKS